MKKKLIVLGISGVLLGAGVVGAQGDGSGGAALGSGATQNQTTESQETESQVAEAEADARRSEMLARMVLGRPLDMGSTLTVTFYDGDPEAGGSELQTLEFVYGEDSEAAFAEELETAAAGAGYVTLTTSPQTETYNLAEMQQLAGPDGFGGRRGGPEGRHGPARGFGERGGFGGRSY